MSAQTPLRAESAFVIDPSTLFGASPLTAATNHGSPAVDGHHRASNVFSPSLRSPAVVTNSREGISLAQPKCLNELWGDSPVVRDASQGSSSHGHTTSPDSGNRGNPFSTPQLAPSNDDVALRQLFGALAQDLTPTIALAEARDSPSVGTEVWTGALRSTDSTLMSTMTTDASQRLLDGDIAADDGSAEGSYVDAQLLADIDELLDLDGNGTASGGQGGLSQRQRMLSNTIVVHGGRRMPLSALAAATGGKVGDSPGKLTASELRRLAKQIAVDGASSIPAGALPSGAGELVNGRRCVRPSTPAAATGTGMASSGSTATSVAATSSWVVTQHMDLSAPPSQQMSPTAMSSRTGTPVAGGACDVPEPSARRGAPNFATAAKFPAYNSASAAGQATVTLHQGSRSERSGGSPPSFYSAFAIASERSRTPSPTQRRGASLFSIGSGSGKTVPAAHVPSVTVMVDFKMGRRMRCRCPVSLAERFANAIGSVYVVVRPDGIDGEDAGVCSAMYSAAQHVPIELACAESGVVLRVAGPEDCLLINDALPLLEERAMEACCQKLASGSFQHLEAECIDAEYRLDQGLLTLFVIMGLPQVACAVRRSQSAALSPLQLEMVAKMACPVRFAICNHAHEITEMTPVMERRAPSTLSVPVAVANSIEAVPLPSSRRHGNRFVVTDGTSSTGPFHANSGNAQQCSRILDASAPPFRPGGPTPPAGRHANVPDLQPSTRREAVGEARSRPNAQGARGLGTTTTHDSSAHSRSQSAAGSVADSCDSTQRAPSTAESQKSSGRRRRRSRIG